MNKRTVLLVEDEQRLSNVIAKYLHNEGYQCHQEYRGAQALAQVERCPPDLIILDIMLPDMDGYSVCKAIRKLSTVPIILLTARVHESDRINGFAVGADDYVCKPFSPQELMCRVSAILRRVYPEPSVCKLSHGPLTLILSEHKVQVDGQDVVVTHTEFQLLKKLMAKPSQVFTREELLTCTQGKYLEHYERTIDSHIKNLRKKINIRKSMNYIKTVYGVGYKLVAD
ncbi:MAG TPA: response regulator transcription factor [Marinagarivorans sp.]